MATPTDILSPLHFHTLLTSTPFLIADFYATWCPPCKTIAPFYNQLAQSHSQPGKIVFVKVNVDSNQELAAKYDVTAMPTFLVFRDGKRVEGGNGLVRGADVRGLKNAVEGCVEEAKKRAAQTQAPAAKADVRKEVESKGEEGKEEKTVSGNYGMTSGSGWRMKV
ncbi:thioredoxin-domain-containing protein [Delitschia confertaspora ATCC 74209]|uniref:Thioredoxin-domain-containing protein n=1 Tax=Delitschia confertaspora ATCC 74209 TaxID=1513339 RepID=A0A9P4JFT6_9PLEO|nr:thioredoxin-domain-containing protein [Delitschia confertaspora ATCC 74209]